MSSSVSKKLDDVIQIDQKQVIQHLMELVAERLRHIAGTRWGTRKHLDMKKLSEMVKGEEVIV